MLSFFSSLCWGFNDLLLLFIFFYLCGVVPLAELLERVSEHGVATAGEGNQQGREVLGVEPQAKALVPLL